MKKISLQEVLSEAKFSPKEYYPLGNNIQQDQEDYNYNTLNIDWYTYFIEKDNETPWLETYCLDLNELILGTGEILNNIDILNFPYPIYKLDELEHCKYVVELNKED